MSTIPNLNEREPVEETQEETQEVKELRSRDECEQQLAVELAVGAVDSIDNLIDQGHETACEYACQLLFDNLRLKVATRKDLPVRIVQHLLKDRCEDVRLTVIRTNWETLTPEQQEEVICNAEHIFSQETDEEKERRNRRYSSVKGPTRKIEDTIKPLLKAALLAGDESKSLRYAKIIGISNGLPVEKPELVPVLKSLPSIFRLYWKEVSVWQRPTDIILAHPDEKVRMGEVQKILDKRTRVDGLNEWQRVVGRSQRGGDSLKTKILKLWVTDSSEKIRRFIAETTTSTEVLEMLSTDASSTIATVAYPRYKKFQKRAEYSKAYHERKLKKQQERGW